jgi:transposase
MRMIKDVLRLKFDGGFSHDRIAASLGISKGVVTKYLGLAGEAGLDWSSACDMDEGELERRLLGKPTGPAAYAQPDYGRIHQELRRKGVTLTLLWEEYQTEFADRQTYRYTQFCEHYRTFAKRLKRSMRQIHRAGEKLFVDFAGPTLPLTTGRRAHIFVAAMGASSYTFACATPAETMEDWLGGIARALTFYGGGPQLIVIDFVAGNKIVNDAARAAAKPLKGATVASQPCLDGLVEHELDILVPRPAEGHDEEPRLDLRARFMW